MDSSARASSQLASAYLTCFLLFSVSSHRRRNQSSCTRHAERTLPQRNGRFSQSPYHSSSSSTRPSLLETFHSSCAAAPDLQHTRASNLWQAGES